MWDPSAVIHNSAYLYICRHESVDYHVTPPLSVRLNPLRYEIGIRTRRNSPPRWSINEGGKWRVRWSNFTWRLYRKRWREYREHQQ